MNADTGQVYYEKKPNERYRMLSITKLLTAEVLMDALNGDLSDRISIQQSDLAPGSTAELKPGDVWSVQDLLYGMLLVSGNDASNAIARYGGSVILAMEGRGGNGTERFLQAMRDKARTLGANQTEVADPHGMSRYNVSTARDLALLGANAFRDPRLLPYWQCTQRTVQIGGPNPRAKQMKDIIEIVGEPGIVGAKTGSYFSKGLYNLIVGWRAPNGQTIVIVVLGAPTHPARYDDVRLMIDRLPSDYPEMNRPTSISDPAPPPFSAECR
ncbi:D-alanyl-D-alanine carboxypeptidase DacF precursor [Methyloligella halotolerans]|uniref:D-alanyl-D-alanine carboxypeptidase DacF n=2 Tax=Methyloligella halotolerans TaxID=1177755 RepID=A0A1E2RZE7_9HYPH|nr:D-alanyl-D-alanine carboxypeptidase DacF precursor [Methyloligella halotolerans]